MDATALCLDARTETFADMKDFLHRLVGKFITRHGGDWDDYLSFAYMTFLESFARFNPSKGSFHKFVSTRVWYRLMEERREGARKHKCRRIGEVCPDTLPTRRTFSWVELMDSLSEDGQTVIRLTFGKDVAVAVAGMRQNRPDTIRHAIREVLTDIGWDEDRITSSFDEILDVLCDD